MVGREIEKWRRVTVCTSAIPPWSGRHQPRQVSRTAACAPPLSSCPRAGRRHERPLPQLQVHDIGPRQWPPPGVTSGPEPGTGRGPPSERCPEDGHCVPLGCRRVGARSARMCVASSRQISGRGLAMHGKRRSDPRRWRGRRWSRADCPESLWFGSSHEGAPNSCVRRAPQPRLLRNP